MVIKFWYKSKKTVLEIMATHIDFLGKEAVVSLNENKIRIRRECLISIS